MASILTRAKEIEQPRRRARLHALGLASGASASRLGSSAPRGSIWEKSKPIGAAAALLPGGRLHLQHGPIDCVAGVFGEPAAVREAHARASARFATVLEELVAELPALRLEGMPVTGVVAQRMAAAVALFRPVFITPMAAVAGAVAEEVLAAMIAPGITRAYVNNGGDIALWLGPGERLTAAMAVTGGRDRVTLCNCDGVGGIATSGWGGRSFSLGIADAVTVLARSAAMADAAATMIANAVDLPGHPGILRRPACDLKADSDLGARLVTVAVPVLSDADRSTALDAGVRAAEVFRDRGLIVGAALYLQGQSRICGAFGRFWEGRDD
jgi:uncharacterized protein